MTATARYVRIPEAVERTGLSKRTLYRKIERGRFPKQVQLSDGAVGWPVEAIDAWLEAPDRWAAT